jgi:hypothetical protein
MTGYDVNEHLPTPEQKMCEYIIACAKLPIKRSKEIFIKNCPVIDDTYNYKICKTDDDSKISEISGDETDDDETDDEVTIGGKTMNEWYEIYLIKKCGIPEERMFKFIHYCIVMHSRKKTFETFSKLCNKKFDNKLDPKEWYPIYEEQWGLNLRNDFIRSCRTEKFMKLPEFIAQGMKKIGLNEKIDWEEAYQVYIKVMAI